MTVAVACACAASAASAQSRIYWTNAFVPSITFANLDGSGGFGTLTTSAEVIHPEGVVEDPADGKIYWANTLGGPTGMGSIAFANLDGTGGGTLRTGSATINEPFGLAIDRAQGRIYWANSAAVSPAPGISFANLDGSGGGDLFTGTAPVSTPIGVAIDPAAGKIFWADRGSNQLSFAFLDGVRGGGKVDTGPATVVSPEGVALDLSDPSPKIYWANQTGDKISFAKLDATGGGDVDTTGATTPDTPSGVAIDPVAGRIYWANQGNGIISFANLHKSGAGDLNTTGSTSTNASLPSILEGPVGGGVPTVTGGTTVSTQLGCTQGIWGPDLLASLLYQAPQSFSFSWFKDGTQISGAANSLFQATSPGSYTCRVTAKNFAGSNSQTSAPFTVSLPPPPPPPPTVTATASASGLIANVTVTCHGVAGQHCAGPIKLTASAGKAAAASVVPDRKHKGKHKKGGKLVTVGNGSYSLDAGRSEKVTIPLNKSGKKRLAASFKLSAKVTFPGTSAKAKAITFRIARIQIDHHQLVWSVTVGSFTSAFSLVAKPVPAGSKIKVSCSGRGCPFASKTVKTKKHSVSLTSLFGSSKLKPGARVTFTITAKNHVGEVLTYSLQAKPVIPSPTIKCVPPGSHRAVAC